MQNASLSSANSVNGSLNLPTEILEQILRLAVDDWSLSSLFHGHEHGTAKTGEADLFPIMIVEEADTFDAEWPKIFQTRLSTRLVCRLWNAVAQPLCDALVSLNGPKSYPKIQRFREALQESVGYHQNPRGNPSSDLTSSPSSTRSSVSSPSRSKTRLHLIRGLSLTINPYDFIVPTRHLLWSFIPSPSLPSSPWNSPPTSNSETDLGPSTEDNVEPLLHNDRPANIEVAKAGDNLIHDRAEDQDNDLDYRPRLKWVMINNWSENQFISWSDLLTDISHLEHLEVLAINGQTYALPYDDTTLIDKQSLHHLHTLDISLQVRDQEFHWGSDRIPLFSAIQEWMSFPNLKNLRIRDIHPRIVTSIPSIPDTSGPAKNRNQLVKFLECVRNSLVHLDLEVTGIVAMGSMVSQPATAYEQFRWTSMYNYNSTSPYSTRVSPHSINANASDNSTNMQCLTHLEVAFPFECFLISTLPIYPIQSASTTFSPSSSSVPSYFTPITRTPLETITINVLNRILEWTDAGPTAEQRVWSFNSNRLDTMFDVIYRHFVYDTKANDESYGTEANGARDEDLRQTLANSRKSKPWSPPPTPSFRSDSYPSHSHSTNPSCPSLKTIVLGDFYFHPTAWSRGDAFWYEFHAIISRWVERFSLSRYSNSYHDITILARESRSHPAMPVLQYLDAMFKRTKRVFEESRVAKADSVTRSE